MNSSEPPFNATIVDALSRATLTLADLGGLTARELDALYFCGQRALSLGQTQEAIVLFSLATRLMPYQPRFWRALGVAFHHQGDVPQALTAYQAALYLHPEHALTQIYYAEILCLAGQIEKASQTALALPADLPPEVASRQNLLNQFYFTKEAKQAEPPVALSLSIRPALDLLMNAQEMTLTDGRSLPLDAFDSDALTYPKRQDDTLDRLETVRERTGLTALALGDKASLAGADSAGALEFTPEEATRTTVRVFEAGSSFAEKTSELLALSSDLGRNEPTGAFRLRLKLAALDEEITLTRAAFAPTERAQGFNHG